MLQDLLGTFVPSLKQTHSWTANMIASGLCVACWGYFLYQGVVDPLGGINTLWPLFGISNQMLAGVALIFCTVVLFKMKRHKYAWVTIVPMTWLLVTTLIAGWQKLFHDSPRIGFLALARRFSDAIDKGIVLAPAKDMKQMYQIMVNNYIDAALAGMFICVVLAILGFGLRACVRAYRENQPTAQETPYQPMLPHKISTQDVPGSF
jgi:carbon starvation protein